MNGKINNKSGLRFGKLLVLKLATNEEIVANNLSLTIGKNKERAIYFWCECDCGTIKLILSQTLKSEHSKNPGTRSCGCLGKTTKISKNPRLTSAKYVYRQIYSDGNLSFDDFLILSSRDCFYCGAPPANKTNVFNNPKRNSEASIKNGEFIYNGLDRVDNTKPHDSNNLVPCCYICNRAKFTLTYSDFNKWLNRIAQFNTQKYTFVSHRANIAGPSKLENHPSQIKKVLSMGFEVEIDLRVIDGKFVLGHDIPQYEIEKNFLFSPGLWVHAKSIETMMFLLQYRRYINCFMHDADPIALTTLGYIWTHYKDTPLLTKDSVAVLPELTPPEYDLSTCFGICTDYPLEFRKSLKFRPTIEVVEKPAEPNITNRPLETEALTINPTPESQS